MCEEYRDALLADAHAYRERAQTLQSLADILTEELRCFERPRSGEYPPATAPRPASAVTPTRIWPRPRLVHSHPPCALFARRPAAEGEPD